MTTVDITPISGHDDCQLLSQPVTAYDLQVRYDKHVSMLDKLSLILTYFINVPAVITDSFNKQGNNSSRQFSMTTYIHIQVK